MQQDMNDGDQFCREVISRVLKYGVTSAPRGRGVIEIDSPSVFTLTDPRRPLITTPVRAANYRFGMAEACWIAAGSNDLKSLTRHVTRMSEFSDDGDTLWGAYGPRVVGQLPHVIETLKRDRDSRQAVITTWRPMVEGPLVDGYENTILLENIGGMNGNTPIDVPPNWDGASWRSKDVPCTVGWHFMIRKDKLNLTVFMRSNDAWLGTPYDLLSFTTIQRCVASILEVDVGVYNHVVSNLHLYTDQIFKAEEMLLSASTQRYSPLEDFKFKSIDEMRAKMALACDGKKSDDPGADVYSNVINKSHRVIRSS